MKISIRYKYSLSNETVSAILLSLYMLVGFSQLFLPLAYKNAAPLVMSGIGIFSGIFAIIYQRSGRINYLVFLIWTLLVLAFIALQIINTELSFSFLIIISNICLSYFILYSKFNLRINYLCFFVIAGLLLIKTIDQGHIPAMFIGASRNWVSATLLINTSLLYFIEWKQNKRISLWPSALAFVISILAIGRSGMVSTGILFFGVLFCKMLSLPRKINRIILMVMAAALLLVINLNDHLPLMRRLIAQGFESNERFLMIKNYLAQMNIKTILLGYNYNNDPFFLEWSLNPHNSFISLHHTTGLFFFIVVLVFFFLFLRFFKHSKALFLVLLALFFRGMTDTIFFIGKYDFIFIVLFLYANEQGYRLYETWGRLKLFSFKQESEKEKLSSCG